MLFGPQECNRFETLVRNMWNLWEDFGCSANVLRYYEKMSSTFFSKEPCHVAYFLSPYFGYHTCHVDFFFFLWRFSSLYGWSESQASPSVSFFPQLHFLCFFACSLSLWHLSWPVDLGFLLGYFCFTAILKTFFGMFSLFILKCIHTILFTCLFSKKVYL